ncbi:MAG TPA: VacB/RNase II family 3'-5' exoribonuclease [Terriglobia bacterium]|nr:VacB/RNase II family 3'-5' exoribonuclease [Terriglobia bacterium]
MRELLSPAELLKFFEKHPAKTFRLRQLMAELGLRSSQARELKGALRRLAGARKIVHLKQNQFVLAKQSFSKEPQSRGSRAVPRLSEPRAAFHDASGRRAPNVVTGRLIGHRDGYGFVVPDAQSKSATQDIFIPPGEMASAMHGDKVEVRVVSSKRDGRLEGRIHRVVDRAQKTVVGEFHYGARYNFVAPFDLRIPREIVIPPGQERPSDAQEAAKRNRQFGGESEGKRGAARSAQDRGGPVLENMIVDVEITSFAQPGGVSNPRGRVIEILGRRDEFGVDVEIMIRKFHIPHRFPAEVLAEAADQAQFISELEHEGRRDFRSFPIVTIDGETAKDFDDAVYVERLNRPNGARYLLQVHIADVAHYVRPGSALDAEARLRGTSVYFPDRAVPMLPLDLSNGICSLNPHVDRLTMSALMEIDSTGRVVSYEITPGVIRSAERMTYTAVRDVLAGDPAACERYRSLIENFKLMEELAKILNRARDQRGSIDFDLPEPEIEFDEHGRMVGVTRSERNFAHRLIEEFMLAANETVAEYLERKGVPSLYRVHETPDPKKVLEFEEIAATFGYSLGVELPAMRRMRVERQGERDRHPRFHERLDADSGDFKITPRHYQRLTQRIAGKPEERILSYLMLRSLKQAHYSEENVGHFALASGTYTHFTSPIRRYPDLIVHRILKTALAKDGQGKGLDAKQLHALGLETSEAERRATEAERELMEWKKVAFMAGRMGEEFDALLISVTKHGLFVELVDLFVEGLVPLDSLEGDRYVHREKLRAAVGERSKHAYSLGDRVKVRLDRIERSGNRLQFSVVK